MDEAPPAAGDRAALVDTDMEETLLLRLTPPPWFVLRDEDDDALA